MPRPRKTCVSLDDTPYYHCISRSVRRAFRCEECKLWVSSKLRKLSTHKRRAGADYLPRLGKGQGEKGGGKGKKGTPDERDGNG
jgi:hypothetical protein